MEENENPQPSPNPTHPMPGGGNPIEIDTGDLHSRPEVDIGNLPDPEADPVPETDPEPERRDPQ
jgi:hypothetical protein